MKNLEVEYKYGKFCTLTQHIDELHIREAAISLHSLPNLLILKFWLWLETSHTELDVRLCDEELLLCYSRL